MNRHFLLSFLGISLLSAALGCHRSKEVEPAAKVALNKAVPDRLSVTIWPRTTRISMHKHFEMLLRVTNASEQAQSFEVFGATWSDHWQPDNPRIQRQYQEATKNIIRTIKLEPGESYEKEMKPDLLDGPPLKIIAFKMGFTPRDENKTYWSNRVVLGIQPGNGRDLSRFPTANNIGDDGSVQIFSHIPSRQPRLWPAGS